MSAKDATIVIVEDDLDVATLFDDVATELGFKTTRVQKASELLALLQEGHIAIAIIDLGAVQDAGADVVEELRKAGVRAVWTTGSAAHQRPLWAYDLDILMKPFELDELVAHIRGSW